MSVQAIIIAAVVVGAVGIILGFFLGVSGEKLKVEVDPREEEILGVLPGNNCGGCGYPGCSGLAAAIVAAVIFHTTVWLGVLISSALVNFIVYVVYGGFFPF